MKEVVAFRQEIDPGERLVLKERMKDRGIIEKLYVRFYSGVENSLRVRPFVMHNNRSPEDFLTYNANSFITGEDDYFEFPVSIWIDIDDDLCVEVVNVDLNFTYSLVCDIVVSYDEEGGGI